MGPEDLSVGLKNGETQEVADLEPAKNDGSSRLNKAVFSGEFSITGGLQAEA